MSRCCVVSVVVVTANLSLPVMGFIVCSVTFGACGLWFDTLSKPEYVHWFQLLYYTSSFFGQVP